MKLGFPPDTISTDIHSSSILGTQSDMPNCMSKMLTLGMELKEIVYRSTVTPARAVNHFPEIGTLGETFNSMTDKIEEQIANLAKAAAERSTVGSALWLKNGRIATR